jgi:hypothetical protein
MKKTMGYIFVMFYVPVHFWISFRGMGRDEKVEKLFGPVVWSVGARPPPLVLTRIVLYVSLDLS